MRIHIGSRHIATWLLVACGVWLVGLGLYFMLLRPPLLAEDLRYMNATLDQIRNTAPGLEGWLKKVFTVMGGFMASAGLLAVFTAATAMPRRLTGTPWAISLSGVLSVGLMSVTNFALDSDFRWLLLVPALLWLAGVVVYIGRRRVDSSLGVPTQQSEERHRVYRTLARHLQHDGEEAERRAWSN